MILANLFSSPLATRIKSVFVRDGLIASYKATINDGVITRRSCGRAYMNGRIATQARVEALIARHGDRS